MDWLSFTLSVTLDSARLMREAMILFYTGTSNFSLRDVREGTGLDGLTQVYLSICTGTIQFRNANIYLTPQSGDSSRFALARPCVRVSGRSQLLLMR